MSLTAHEHYDQAVAELTHGIVEPQRTLEAVNSILNDDGGSLGRVEATNLAAQLVHLHFLIADQL